MVLIPPGIKLNEIEKDIQPEDFPEGSIWRTIVKECGPAALIILARYRETVAERLSLRDYVSVTRKAQQRNFIRRNKKAPTT
jgi:hypothetical protein